MVGIVELNTIFFGLCYRTCIKDVLLTFRWIFFKFHYSYREKKFAWFFAIVIWKPCGIVRCIFLADLLNLRKK